MITQIGTEDRGVVIVEIDRQHNFEYPYSPESPSLSHEQLALLAMAQC
ncbi:MAG: hypothetical protein WBM44_06045 [Waterburya sp.]